MGRRKKEYWWVVAYDKARTMGYLRSECSSESEALGEIEKLRKKEPEFRYEYFQVR